MNWKKIPRVSETQSFTVTNTFPLSPTVTLSNVCVRMCVKTLWYQMFTHLNLNLE